MKNCVVAENQNSFWNVIIKSMYLTSVEAVFKNDNIKKIDNGKNEPKSQVFTEFFSLCSTLFVTFFCISTFLKP